MSNPFLGEIRLFAGNFAPRGWAQANGQLIQISQNTALFSLLGTYYGGDGQNTFALPDFRGRTPMHQGQGPGLSQRTQGEQGGAEFVVLQPRPIPSSPAAPVSASVGFRPQLQTVSPFLVLNFIIALQGIFPARN
jgi:microcystin-dependent protein